MRVPVLDRIPIITSKQIMTRDKLIKRAEELVELGNAVLATRQKREYTESIDTGKMHGFRSAALSFIERLYGSGHSHYKEFDSSTNSYHPNHARSGISILESIRDEIGGDWLFSVRGLITAEVFSDFIEMANHLSENGYKDPAAVIAGSVLEEHLRQLCYTSGIDVEFSSKGDVKPKKADRLNSELSSADVYSKLDQKAITMWLDVRNKAAHGQFDEYNDSQVSGMISGIVEFMARVPA